MIEDEITAYLAGQGLGLTIAPPTPNLFTRPFPETGSAGPNVAACIGVWNTSTIEHYGESLSAPSTEIVDFKIIVRGEPSKDRETRLFAYRIWQKLRRLGPIVLSGVRYANIQSARPMFLSDDEAKRPRYHFDARAWKEESPAA